jgi:hypothetical protein
MNTQEMVNDGNKDHFMSRYALSACTTRKHRELVSDGYEDRLMTQIRTRYENKDPGAKRWSPIERKTT